MDSEIFCKPHEPKSFEVEVFLLGLILSFQGFAFWRLLKNLPSSPKTIFHAKSPNFERGREQYFFPDPKVDISRKTFPIRLCEVSIPHDIVT